MQKQTKLQVERLAELANSLDALDGTILSDACEQMVYLDNRNTELSNSRQEDLGEYTRLRSEHSNETVALSQQLEKAENALEEILRTDHQERQRGDYWKSLVILFTTLDVIAVGCFAVWSVHG